VLAFVQLPPLQHPAVMDSFPTAKISPSETRLREICPVYPFRGALEVLCRCGIDSSGQRSPLFWGVKQRRLTVRCRRFGTNYRLHPRRLLDPWSGPYRLYRNVCIWQPTLRNFLERRRFNLRRAGSLTSHFRYISQMPFIFRCELWRFFVKPNASSSDSSVDTVTSLRAGWRERSQSSTLGSQTEIVGGEE